MMRKRSHHHAFTLVELLVVIVVMALLMAASLPIYRTAIDHAHCSVCASNMHGLGIAFLSYAYDNQGALPQRVVTGNKWPTLLLSYIGDDTRIYVDPGDPVATQIPSTQLISNTVNNSSFIFNGFNDLGAEANPNVTVSIYNLPSTSGLIVLGQQIAGGDNFYLDVNDGDQNNVLKKQAYFGGSNYVFADGSLRYMKSTEYSDSMWLVNQSYVIPGS
jgi:prepilin-type N-terminal cleavage/methylation domain-containing protein